MSKSNQQSSEKELCHRYKAEGCIACRFWIAEHRHNACTEEEYQNKLNQARLDWNNRCLIKWQSQQTSPKTSPPFKLSQHIVRSPSGLSPKSNQILGGE